MTTYEGSVDLVVFTSLRSPSQNPFDPDEYLEIAEELRGVQETGRSLLWMLVGDRETLDQFAAQATDVTRTPPTKDQLHLRNGLVEGKVRGVPFQAFPLRWSLPDNICLGHAMRWVAAFHPDTKYYAAAQPASRQSHPGERFEAAVIASSLRSLERFDQNTWAGAVVGPPSEASLGKRVLHRAVPADSLSGFVASASAALAFGGPLAHPDTPGWSGLTMSLPYLAPGVINGRSEASSPAVGQPPPPVITQRLKALADPKKWDNTIPWVSILTATHPAHAKYLPEAYESIRDQEPTSARIAWCLQFDGDLDTPEGQTVISLVKRIRREGHIDLRFEANGEPLGAALSSNSALERASDGLCLHLDADDVLARNAISLIVDRMSDNPQLGWLLGRTIWWWVEKDGTTARQALDNAPPARHPGFVMVPAGNLNHWSDDPGSTPLAEQLTLIAGREEVGPGSHYQREHLLVVRTQLARAIGGRSSMGREEDYDLLYRLAEAVPGVIEETPLRAYRRHSEQITASQADAFRMSLLVPQARHMFRLPVAWVFGQPGRSFRPWPGAGGNPLAATQAALSEVCQRFDLGELTEAQLTPKRPSRNEKWRLTTDRGVFVVEHLKTTDQHSLDRTELGVQLRKAAADAGLDVAVPVLETATNKGIVQVGTEHFHVSRWSDGSALGQGTVTPEATRAICHTLAKVHELSPGEDQAALTPVWVMRAEYWLRIASDGETIPEVAELILKNATRLAQLQQDTNLHDPPGKKCRGHGDLAPSEIIAHANGSRWTIMGWGQTRIVVAAQEGIATAGRFAETGNHRIDESRFRAGVAGYLEGTSLGTPAAPWMFGEWVNRWVGSIRAHISLDPRSQAPELHVNAVRHGIETLRTIDERMADWLRYIDSLSGVGQSAASSTPRRTGVSRTRPHHRPTGRRASPR